MAKTIQSAKLVTTTWLEENLESPSIRIVEVSDMRDPRIYFEGHIPGAVYWPWQESLWHPTDREFVSPEDFPNLMGKSGIGHDTTIIFYSHSPQFSTYAFWICTMRGHSNTKILNGGRPLWIRENKSMTKELPKIEPVGYPMREIDERWKIGRKEVLAGLDNPDRVLLDLRSREEYVGERVSPKIKVFEDVDFGAYRKGHVPGAKHLFYGEFFNEDGTYKTLEELQESFDTRGATRDKEIVTYCRLSHRASMGWFVAVHLLGYSNVKIYDGSWTEWGNIVGYPIVNESLK
jgi:thiosulfate/3-mercaptopyruvate sulfurtransferase